MDRPHFTNVLLGILQSVAQDRNIIPQVLHVQTVKLDITVLIGQMIAFLVASVLMGT